MYKLEPTTAGAERAHAASAAERKTAAVAGWLMAATFITAIAGLLLYGPVLTDQSFVLGTGSTGETRVALGALFEVLLMIANVGVAVVMFPILRRYSESLALGYVGSRVVEAVLIGVGAISLLSILTLEGSGGGDASLVVAGETLVAIHDWAFLFGPGFCVGVNGLVLGWLMYRTNLMPPRLALFGVVGGPLIFASSIAVLLGAYPQDGAHFLISVPEIVFEASFAIYLIVKGFRPSPVLTGEAAA